MTTKIYSGLDLNVELLQPACSFCIRKQILFALPVNFWWCTCTQTHRYTHVHTELVHILQLQKSSLNL